MTLRRSASAARAGGWTANAPRSLPLAAVALASHAIAPSLEEEAHLDRRRGARTSWSFGRRVHALRDVPSAHTMSRSRLVRAPRRRCPCCAASSREQRAGLRHQLLGPRASLAAEHPVSTFRWPCTRARGPRLCVASWRIVASSPGSGCRHTASSTRRRASSPPARGARRASPCRCRGSPSRRCGRGLRSRPGPSSEGSRRSSRRSVRDRCPR